MTIWHFDDQHELVSFLSHFALYKIPDECPICHNKISASYVLAYEFGSNLRVVFKCPSADCNELFIGHYVARNMGGNRRGCDFLCSLPSTPSHRSFPDPIQRLSPTFIDIYNQSITAESIGLDQICGVGYRKALEFLIKDYLIYLTPTDAENIKKILLGPCLKKLPNPRIQAISERAVWIGNDETHYVRKWEGKDIQDLKALIDITVHFISMELEFDKYMVDMSEGKK